MPLCSWVSMHASCIVCAVEVTNNSMVEHAVWHHKLVDTHHKDMCLGVTATAAQLPTGMACSEQCSEQRAPK